VKAYSNAARVRLRLNDEDQGLVPCEGGVCLWHAVRLHPGPNALLATADIAGTTLSDSIQWTYSGSLDKVRIKAGSMSGYVSKAGERYGSDTYFTGGNGRGLNAPDTPMSERATVAGEDAGLYYSFREGAFSYHVPVPSGRYRVTLHFAEPAADKAGVREFDVLANGAIALGNFDIYAAAGGKLKGVARSFDAISRGDGVLIEFRPKIGNALVTALSISLIDRY
jgi:beta-galactosidase